MGMLCSNITQKMRERWGWWIHFWFSNFFKHAYLWLFTIVLCTILGLWFRTQVTTDPQLSSFLGVSPSWPVRWKVLFKLRHPALVPKTFQDVFVCIATFAGHIPSTREWIISSVYPILSPIWAVNSSFLLLYNFCPLCPSMSNAFWEIRIFQLICFSFWRPWSR